MYYKMLKKLQAKFIFNSIKNKKISWNFKYINFLKIIYLKNFTKVFSIERKSLYVMSKFINIDYKVHRFDLLPLDLV